MALKMMTQGEVVSEISERTGITRTDVKHVIAELEDVAREEISAAHRFKIGSIVQLEPKVRKGIKKGAMVMNPAKGKMVKHKGKPPSIRVAARTLSGVAKGDHLPSVQKVQRAKR